MSDEFDRENRGTDEGKDELKEQSPDFVYEELPQKSAKSFQLHLDDELKRIPDYSGKTGSAVHRREKTGLTTFAKVMFAVVIVGISVFLAIGIIFTAQEVFGLNKPDQEILVEIPRNSGVQQIAETLEEAGVIKSATMFRAYYKLAKLEGNFQYGTYSLNTNMSFDMIVEELSKYSKSREEVTITFPEGMTLYEVARKLEENKVCSTDDFLSTLDKTDFGFEFEKQISDDPLKFYKLEGFVFPDTYNFYTNDSPVNVANKFLKNFENKMMTAEMSEQMKKAGFTLEETIIVASIVQREAGNVEEMKNIASVYYNRLHSDGVYPNLQADPTRDYANEIKTQMDVVDQTILDAYNTYEGRGLPPGAICNPGLDAIKATLNPNETDYYFFCTTKKGDAYYYAKTLEEHEKNLRKAGLR